METGALSRRERPQQQQQQQQALPVVELRRERPMRGLWAGRVKLRGFTGVVVALRGRCAVDRRPIPGVTRMWWVCEEARRCRVV